MGATAAIAATVIGGIGGTMLARRNAPSAPPAPTPPTPMPTPDDQQVQEAQRRSLAEQLARRGRASTILSDPQNSDVLGP